MSTYLVAMTVGEFQHIEGQGKIGPQIRLHTTPGKKRLERTLNYHIQAFEYFNRLFDFVDPMKKVDVLVVEDFEVAGMENWALIMYAEKIVFYNDHSTMMEEAVTVGHEVAHFWFGNLVTMKWWDDLWLKEGFATFLGHQLAADNYPELPSWEFFLSNGLERAREVDSLISTKAVLAPIQADQLDYVYDSIRYTKSAHFIRMLCDQHAYGNVVSDDLWAAFMDATGMDLKTTYSAWITNPGYPVISVATSSHPGEVTFSARRFIASGALDPNHLGCFGAVDFVQLNPECTGFMIVHYDRALFGKLLNAYRNKELTDVGRFTLVSDTAHLVRAGMSNIDDLVDLIVLSRKERSFMVLSPIADAIDGIRTWLWDSEEYVLSFHFSQFVEHMFNDTLQDIDLGRRELFLAKELRRKIKASTANKVAERDVVWNFMKYNWNTQGLARLLGSPTSRKRLETLSHTLSSFANSTVIQEAKSLFTADQRLTVNGYLRRMEERMTINKRQHELHSRNLRRWLAKRGYGTFFEFQKHNYGEQSRM
ncbi:hypothetical protein QR680_016507 [Steinernema hermaphroditum]|uniref:Peptidase M1 membrane alanine aminopeptidase domain-containing protein n=1 Tax=Steinernema hermaphroditum TaxID=289476 RepID=A0AA39HBF6_9BILA|nr:hypothetical protein QR680_016507 [Steinernema hermaphroditum]